MVYILLVICTLMGFVDDDVYVCSRGAAASLRSTMRERVVSAKRRCLRGDEVTVHMHRYMQQGRVYVVS